MTNENDKYYANSKQRKRSTWLEMYTTAEELGLMPERMDTMLLDELPRRLGEGPSRDAQLHRLLQQCKPVTYP